LEKFTREQRIARAEAFERMWTEYGFDRLEDEIRQGLFREWENSEPHETKKRDDLWRGVQMAKQFKQFAIAIISDGPMAKIELRGRKNHAD
jgi:hypothetical protein